MVVEEEANLQKFFTENKIPGMAPKSYDASTTLLDGLGLCATVHGLIRKVAISLFKNLWPDIDQEPPPVEYSQDKLKRCELILCRRGSPVNAGV